MNIRSLVVLGLSIVCGVAAAFGMRYWSDNSASAEGSSPPVKMVKVVCARVKIPLVGMELKKEMLTIREIPEALVPKDAVTDAETVLGQTIRIPLFAGEPILAGKVGLGQGMSSLLQDGRRAYTIATPSDSSQVAGFVLPGDRVDIYLTLRGKDNDYDGGAMATVLLQNVTVIAVGQLLNAPENRVSKTRNVTFSVTPAQVATLTMALEKGKLTLALRSETDEAELANPGPFFWRGSEFGSEFAGKTKLPGGEKDPADEKKEEKVEKPVPPAVEVIKKKSEPPQEILAIRGRSSGIYYYQPRPRIGSTK